MEYLIGGGLIYLLYKQTASNYQKYETKPMLKVQPLQLQAAEKEKRKYDSSWTVEELKAKGVQFYKNSFKNLKH